MRREAALEQWIAGFLRREQLPASYRDTISGALLPLADALAARVRQSDSLVVVGLCGAQGSGKSTAAAVLCELLGQQDLPALAVSIDDFYLPHADRQELARRVHPLLATRGVPGTHDVELAQAVIESLAEAGETAVPSFDKAIDDRRPRPQWRRVEGPLRAVILEGWCVGARPEPAMELALPLNELERNEDAQGRWRAYVNAALQGPYAPLFARLSPLVLLAAPSFEVVLGWRTEQEHKLRERLQREGADVSRVMSDEAIARFISHYERITRHILAEMPARADHLIALDASRHAQWKR
jgi:D-glycerate 3-kinase